jgi:hypothetical protein
MRADLERALRSKPPVVLTLYTTSVQSHCVSTHSAWDAGRCAVHVRIRCSAAAQSCLGSRDAGAIGGAAKRNGRRARAAQACVTAGQPTRQAADTRRVASHRFALVHRVA